MKTLVLSGIGSLSPYGAGNAVFIQAMSEGKSCISEISKFASLSAVKGGEIKGLDCDDIIGDRKFRRAADVTKYALASTRLALEDAGLTSVNGEDTAMIVAVTHGALNYTEEYHASLLTGGVEDISPILFSESVLNAPAGNASICFGTQGAVHTIVGGYTASIKSVMMACELIDAHKNQKALVLSTEEINQLSYYSRQKQGAKEMSEGAAAILIENSDARKDSEVYCRITGFGSYLNPDNPESSFRTSVQRALEMAGIGKHELHLALIDGPVNIRTEYLRDVVSCTASRFTGQAFCVSSMWNIMLAAHIIKNGVIPAALLSKDKRGRVSDTMEHIVVCGLEENGYAAAIVLSKYERYQKSGFEAVTGRDMNEMKDLIMQVLPQKYLTERMLNFLSEFGVIDLISKSDRYSFDSLFELLGSELGVGSSDRTRKRMIQIIIDFLVECNLIERDDDGYCRGSNDITDYDLDSDETGNINSIYQGQVSFFNQCISEAGNFLKGGPVLFGFNELSLDVWESFLGNAEYEMARQLLIKILTLKKSGKCRVLNLCYGPGYDIRSIQKFMPEAEITAIDYSDVFYDRARRIIHSPDSIQWTDSGLWNGFGDTLPFDDQVFDIVFFACADPYIPEDMRQTVYRDINRIIKKGGSLGILTNSYPDIENNYVKEKWIRRGVLCHDFAESMCEGWNGFHTAEDSIDVFEKAGFRVGTVLLNASLWRLDKL